MKKLSILSKKVERLLFSKSSYFALLPPHHDAYNIIGDKDWPSQTCHGGLSGIERKKDTAYIEIIPQTETDGIVGGHYFLQQDYQKEIQNTIKTKIAKEYEIY